MNVNITMEDVSITVTIAINHIIVHVILVIILGATGNLVLVCALCFSHLYSLALIQPFNRCDTVHKLISILGMLDFSYPASPKAA